VEMELFDTGEAPTFEVSPSAPLADRMRPRTLEEVVGQSHLLGPEGVLTKIARAGKPRSLLLWGPPGCGKTTLARCLAHTFDAAFEAFSAVLCGVKEVRAVVARAKERRHRGRATILFVDEVHRFNKAQQDAFLPHVEEGLITLLGATTENPSFEIIPPLLSRCRVLVLHPLAEEELVVVLERALGDAEIGLGAERLELDEGVVPIMARAAGGDARVALTLLETVVESVPPAEDGARHITGEACEGLIREALLRYDKAGDEHYNLASAMIKSLRGSDVDAALYWAFRMLDAGEDPMFIARRLVIFAAEDVGNADPRALALAVSAQQAIHFVGMPEAFLPLGQAVIYLASAPKSNAVLRAAKAARDAIAETKTLPVPLHLRGAPTALMKGLGHGEGYRYPHSADAGWVEQQYLPDVLKGRVFYEATGRGYEAKMAEYLDRLKSKASEPPPKPDKEPSS